MKKGIILVLSIVFIAFIFFGVSVLKCEYLTTQYGHEFDFAAAATENTMLSEPDWFKVLSCSDMQAKVYVIESDYTLGNVLTFKKVGDLWQYEGWKTIWSARGGSADGNVWPYFWHSSLYR